VSEYFGKYRGTVKNNIDPQMQGRVQVEVPAVTGTGELNWAMPASPSVGFISIPPVHANVWVEYEGGDSGQAIYSGCFWDLGQAPLPATALATPDKVVVVKTKTATLTLSDLPGPLGGVAIEVQGGIKITLNATGITITDGAAKIALQGPTVMVNDGVLQVT
jgi:Type VI secretion system/phage-baseplate injector OB domain